MSHDNRPVLNWSCQCEAIMQELVLTLTANDRERDAMDELEL